MGDIFKNINCGDCSATNPQWASLNHAILLCKDCCLVHRALGPECSRVKSINNSQWHPNVRKMIGVLAAGPANHVWEHTLLDPSSKSDIQIKKPGPFDSLEHLKKKFIHMKHFQYYFVLRHRPETFEERNQELHSTVRTGDLGTTLRLLVSGADPNFFHPEKGTRPLHVAARTGQTLQIELLFLHGAQIDAPDYLGQTPAEHALAAGYKELSLRIVELQYHLTDHLSYYACKEMPDHTNSKHIIIPSSKMNTTKHEIIFKTLSSHVLEQLASDLYDEIDRRQLENEMLGNTLEAEIAKFSIAFLPVHSQYTSVHNQTRQKFARLSEDELVSLVTVVLMESKRRHCNDSIELDMDKDIFLQSKITKDGSKSNCANTTPQIEDDDFPLYDSVASDEDLVLTEQQTILEQQRSTLEETSLSSLSVKPISNCEVMHENEGCFAAKLIESEAKVQELQNSNQNLKLEILILQRMVGSVIHENLELKSAVSKFRKDCTVSSAMPNGSDVSVKAEQPLVKTKPPRPVSLCEGFSADKQEGPARPNTTEVYQRRGIPVGGPELVHESTRTIVELIKVMIEYAQCDDQQGVQLTCSKIYSEAQSMATSVLFKEQRKRVKACLENVLFQVLRMKSEIFMLNDSYDRLRCQFYSSNVSSCEDKLSSQETLQKIKKICFDLGASMKELVSSIV